MVMKVSLVLVLLSVFFVTFKPYTEVDAQNDHNNDPTLTNKEFYMKAESSKSTRSNKEEDGDGAISKKLHLRHRPINHGYEPKIHLMNSALRDLVRIQTLHRKIIEKKNTNSMSRQQEFEESITIQKQNNPANGFVASLESSKDGFSGNIVATLESGASLGIGEYVIDMFVGTPPKHVWLILDTASDLSWIQCDPCYDCFEQNGPYYNPKDSSSYRNISCYDSRCQLVSSPDSFQSCKVENQTCPYFYYYADGSNTTGDFVLEAFTVNLTNGNEKFEQVVDVMFGCGHWNKGFFHGADGVLGLGRAPLSIFKQLQSIYGLSFSYCLTDIFSNTSVSSKLVFGEDKELLNDHNLNFTSLLAEEESLDETFYYLQIKSIMVGGEVLDIPEQTWHSSSHSVGAGTIIDSGSTLTLFPDSAFDVIKKAFEKKIKLPPIVEDDFIMSPCYNVSGAMQEELPSFGIYFADGAVWNFPTENYFYQYEPDEVICLAILNTPNHSPLTIIGNLLQQNFHILYDLKSSRLGYSPRMCAEV